MLGRKTTTPCNRGAGISVSPVLARTIRFFDYRQFSSQLESEAPREIEAPKRSDGRGFL